MGACARLKEIHAAINKRPNINNSNYVSSHDSKSLTPKRTDFSDPNHYSKPCNGEHRAPQRRPAICGFAIAGDALWPVGRDSRARTLQLGAFLGPGLPAGRSMGC